MGLQVENWGVRPGVIVLPGGPTPLRPIRLHDNTQASAPAQDAGQIDLGFKLRQGNDPLGSNMWSSVAGTRQKLTQGGQGSLHSLAPEVIAKMWR